MKVSMTTEVTNKTREQEAWGTKEVWAQSTVNEIPGQKLCLAVNRNLLERVCAAEIGGLTGISVL